jgi:hypothetical protein
MHANQFWVTDSGTPISEVDTFQKYAGGVSCGVGSCDVRCLKPRQTTCDTQTQLQAGNGGSIGSTRAIDQLTKQVEHRSISVC